MYKLLKILRRELFFNQTSLPRLPLCHARWNFGNSKCCFFFQNKRRYKAGNFYKDLLFGHLQPGVHKNSEGLAILILEFDDVMVKTLSKWGFWDCICATHICSPWGACLRLTLTHSITWWFVFCSIRRFELLYLLKVLSIRQLVYTFNSRV